MSVLSPCVPSYALEESKMTFNDIAGTMMLINECLGDLSISKAVMLNYFFKVFNDYPSDQTELIRQYFDANNLSEKQWDHIVVTIGKTIPDFHGTVLRPMSHEAKKTHFLQFVDHKRRYTLLRQCAEMLLEDQDLTSKKISNLYLFAKDLGIQNRESTPILQGVSSHHDKILRMLNNMTSRSKVLSYLYTVQTFIKSGHHVDGKEKDAIMNLRTSYKLDYGNRVFWNEYLGILEGIQESFKFEEAQNELPRIFAAFTLLLFEDDDLNEQELKCLYKALKEFNQDKEFLKNAMNDFKGVPLEEIISELSPRALVLLMIKCFYFAWADGNISKEEFKVFGTISKEIKNRNVVLEDADSYYILFLQFLFEHPEFCLRNEGRDAVAMNRFFKKIIPTKIPFRTTMFFIESFLNTRGIEHDEGTLKTILNCLEIEEDEIPDIIQDCLDQESTGAQKRYMLLGLMKVEYLLHNKYSAKLLNSILEVFEYLPSPTLLEKNCVAYFILRAILFDKEIDEEEKDFFEEIAFEMKVDQEIIRKYTIYLFLETAVKYDFEGWHDYEEYRNEMGIGPRSNRKKSIVTDI